MPPIAAVLQDVLVGKVFSAIDCTSTYWQLSFHEKSQRLYALMTADGVMLPTRTTHGGCNSAANFQVCIYLYFRKPRDNLLSWPDNLALFDMSEEELLAVLSTSLWLYAGHRLVISLSKSQLFARQVRCCSWPIDEEGVTTDLSNIAGIRNISEPKLDFMWCQYVLAAGWMCPSISHLAKTGASDYELQEETYSKTRSGLNHRLRK